MLAELSLLSVPATPASTVEAPAPTLAEIEAAVQQADQAAAQTARLVAPAFAARALYWSIEAARTLAAAQGHLAVARTDGRPYDGDQAAAALRYTALAAAVAARRARAWARRYARALARTTERSS